MRRTNLVVVFISAVMLSPQMASAQSLNEATTQCAEHDYILVAAAEGQQAEPKGTQQPTAPSGAVQQRQIPSGQVGGVHPGTKTQGVEPGFFQCNRKTNTCSCDRTVKNDCDLMNRMVCGGPLECPAFDECTCTAMQ
jgi:hypothetical protein